MKKADRKELGDSRVDVACACPAACTGVVSKPASRPNLCDPAPSALSATQTWPGCARTCHRDVAVIAHEQQSPLQSPGPRIHSGPAWNLQCEFCADIIASVHTVPNSCVVWIPLTTCNRTVGDLARRYSGRSFTSEVNPAAEVCGPSTHGSVRYREAGTV